eukprot:TRINITY_DN16407_c0_g4_i2.p1 TRINITY_DN16407_c0_g4~~TRINITY_DN16407_c0_g4_i2.p1  ORF type:complete len:663 (+),score=168.59 TRINITY_DN16407_c0_g4_i2:133-1989(+)
MAAGEHRGNSVDHPAIQPPPIDNPAVAESHDEAADDDALPPNDALTLENNPEGGVGAEGPENQQDEVTKHLTSLDDIVDSLLDEVVSLYNRSARAIGYLNSSAESSGSDFSKLTPEESQTLRIKVDLIVARILKHVKESDSKAVEAERNKEELQEKVELLEKSLEDNLPMNKVDYESGDIKTSNGAVKTADDEGMKEIMAGDDPALLHEDIRFLADFVYVIVSAAVFGAVAVAMKIPMVVGFIFGGMMVGPSGLGLVVQMKRIDTLAEIGAALILFVQGLEFDTSLVQRFRSLSTWNFFIQICVNGCIFTMALFTILDAEFSFGEGLLLTVSSGLCSSTVAVNLSSDYNLHHGNFFNILGAMLVGQDLMMGLFLCLPEALRQGFLGPLVVVRQLLYAVVLVSGFVYISAKVVPRIAKFFLKTDIPQLFLLSTLSACLSGALMTSMLGLSAEFGAFFAGVALTKTSLFKESLSRIESTKNLFSVLLFSSIGMLISPSFIYHNARTIGILFVIVFTTKFATSFILLRAFGQNSTTATLVALSVAQIAEFSMLLAGKGYIMGLLDRSKYLILLTVAVTTLFFNPLIFKIAMSISCLKTQATGRLITVSGSTAAGARHSASE